jgi:hypothetical protein
VIFICAVFHLAVENGIYDLLILLAQFQQIGFRFAVGTGTSNRKHFFNAFGHPPFHFFIALQELIQFFV